MTILEVEQSKECEDMPDIPMEVAWHPHKEEFSSLWPMYEGEELFQKSGWRSMEAWFGPHMNRGHFSWQVFFGGDLSGATFHWHGAAFNNLYVGAKQWRITPPMYRGFTGMPAREAQNYLDQQESDILLSCVQHAGDLIYIPENWGHSTLTHAFTIGAAVIMPKNYHRPLEIPFFFVHINKTGGTSIITMLRERCPNDFLEETWGEDHRTFHTTAESFINRYGREVWDKAYTFTIVRHPLARQVSNFFFLAGICNNMPMLCKQRHIPEKIQLDQAGNMDDNEKIEAFHQWIEDLYKAYPPGHPNNYLFGSRSQGNHDNVSFNSTQTSWLVDRDGKIVVDNIYHLEKIDSAMPKISKSIPCLSEGANVSPRLQGTKKPDLELVHENVTPRYPDWKKFADNQRTRQILEEVYAVDFKNFGYRWP